MIVSLKDFIYIIFFFNRYEMFMDLKILNFKVHRHTKGEGHIGLKSLKVLCGLINHNL